MNRRMSAISLVLFAAVQPSALLRAQSVAAAPASAEDQIRAAIQNVTAQNYFKASTLISAASVQAESRLGHRLTPERMRVALMSAKTATPQSTISLLNQAMSEWRNSNWESAVYDLDAAGMNVAALDFGAPAADRFVRDSREAQSQSSPGWFHRAARTALDAGQLSEAQALSAREINAISTGLYHAPASTLMMHRAQTLAGIIYLEQNDVGNASAALLASIANVAPGGLGSGGPSMALAARMLQKNQSAKVILYLDRCLQLGWSEGQQKLLTWKSAVSAGQTPDFAPFNLMY